MNWKTPRALVVLFMLSAPTLVVAADEDPDLPPPATRPAGDLHAISDAYVPPSDEDLLDDLRTAAMQRRADVALKVFGGGAGVEQPAPDPAPGPDPAADPLAALDDAVAKLEKQIAELPADDKQLRPLYVRALTEMKKTREQIRRQEKDRPANPTPPPPPPPPARPVEPEAARVAFKKLPPAAGDPVTTDQALANARALADELGGPQAIAALRARAEYNDAAKLRKIAAGAAAASRHSLALACAVRAVELSPDDPDVYAELGGILCVLTRPHEALAVLDAAETKSRSSKKPITGVMGIDGRAMLLSNRGFALLLIRKPAEAEQALREAVRLAPMLREAKVNLAHALFERDKLDEAVQYYATGYRRSPVPPGEQAPQPPAPPADPPADPPDPAKPEEPKPAEDPEPAERRRPAYAVLDLSRPKRGNLPTVKTPKTVEDAAALFPKISRLKKEEQAKLTALVARYNELHDKIAKRRKTGRINPITDLYGQAVMEAIRNSDNERHIRPKYRAMMRAHMQRNVGLYRGQFENVWASKEVDDKVDELRRQLAAGAINLEQLKQGYCEAHSREHVRWLPAYHGAVQTAGAYFKASYAHKTALAANLADPDYLEMARAVINAHAVSTFLTHVVAPLEEVCRHDDYVNEYACRKKMVVDPEAVGEYELEEATGCPAWFGGGGKATFDLEIVEFSGNCEKIAVEVKLGEIIYPFAEFEYAFAGKATVFVGIKVEAELPIVGGPGTSEKLGLYFTEDTTKPGGLGENGRYDFGIKGAASDSVSVGPFGLEYEVESNYSVTPAFQ